MRTDLLTNENLIVTRVFCGHVVLSTALLTFKSIIRFDLRARQWLRARSYHTDIIIIIIIIVIVIIVIVIIIIIIIIIIILLLLLLLIIIIKFGY